MSLYAVLLGWALVVASIYVLSGVLVVIVSPLVILIRNLSYKNVTVSRFMVFWNVSTRVQGILNFSIRHLTVLLNVSDLTRRAKNPAQSPKSQDPSEDPGRSKMNKLKHYLLRQALKLFPGVSLHIYNTNIVLKGLSDSLTLQIPRFKFACDVHRKLYKNDYYIEAIFQIDDAHVFYESPEFPNTEAYQKPKNILRELQFSACFQVNKHTSEIHSVKFNFINEIIRLQALTLMKWIYHFMENNGLIPEKESSEEGDKSYDSEETDVEGAHDADEKIAALIEKTQRISQKYLDFSKYIESCSISLSQISIEELHWFFLDLNSKNFVEVLRLLPDNQFLTSAKFGMNISKLAVGFSRLNRRTPGFELKFFTDDEPLQVLGSILNLQVMMKLEEKEFQIFSLPAANISVQTNFFVQTLQALQKGANSKAVIHVSGHVTSPITEMPSNVLGSLWLHAKQVKHIFGPKPPKARTELPNLSSVCHLMPMVSAKVTIEDAAFVVRSADSMEPACVALSINVLGIETQGKRLPYSTEFNTTFKSSIDASGVRAHYQKRGTNSFSRDEIFVLDHWSLKTSSDHVPNFRVGAVCHFQTAKLVFEDIGVLQGLSNIADSTHLAAHAVYEVPKGKISKLAEQGYSELTASQFLNADDIVPPHAKLRKRWQQKDPKDLMYQSLPVWFKSFEISGSDFQVIIGARSLLVPRNRFKDSFVSPHDFVRENQLRETVFSAEHWEVSLKEPEKEDSSQSSAASLSAVSTDESDDTEDTSSMNAETQDHFWQISFKLQNLKSTVLSSDKRGMPKKYEFVHIPETFGDLSAVQEWDSEKKFIFLDVSIPEIVLNYSIHLHFVHLSAFTLFRNTVLSFYESREKKKHKSSFDLVVQLKVAHFDCMLSMPQDLEMKLQFLSLSLLKKDTNLDFNTELARLSIISPSLRSYWERLVVVNRICFVLDLTKLKQFKDDKSYSESVGIFTYTSSRISVPFNFVIHKIFDNVSLMHKVLKQLHYSFAHNSPELILKPKPVVNRPVLPNIDIRADKFLFNMDDEPFESQLGSAYQAGRLEQLQRLSKVEYFADTLDKKYFAQFSATYSVSVFDKKFEYIYRDSKVWKMPLDFLMGPRVWQEAHNVHLHHWFQKFEVLQRNLSTSWIRRIHVIRQKFLAEIQRHPDYLWKMQKNTQFPKNFNKRIWEGTGHGPPLLSVVIEELSLRLGDILLPNRSLGDFLYDVGKKMPRDTQFSTLVPFHIDLTLKELRAHLRDYPVPLVQLATAESLRIHGNVVIGEEFYASPKSVREICVDLVPLARGTAADAYHRLVVPKTLASVKTFIDLEALFSGIDDTRASFTWGTSYQPGIQQIMLNFDNFTKPPFDISEKVGFWDKLRASIHGRVRWIQPQGSLEVLFKGGRDPYAVRGHNAGFVLSFQRQIELKINEVDDPDKFVVVTAESVRWLVPNLVARPLAVWSRSIDYAVFVPALDTFNKLELAHYYLTSPGNIFDIDLEKLRDFGEHYCEKPVISLLGGVRFEFGVSFERKLDPRIDQFESGENGETRSSQFIPHYQIRLTNPKYVEPGSDYDAYRGFRSHFIHMRFQLTSLQAHAKNSFNFTPKVFLHFFKWWKLFNSNMALPVRHGKIFGPSKPTKKFSVYLDSIRYRFELAKVFIAHIIRDLLAKSLQDQKFSSQYKFGAAGLKAFLESVTMDLLQQKRQIVVHKKILNTTKKISKMAFHVGTINVNNVDLRLLQAKSDDTSDAGNCEDVAPHSLFSFDKDSKWLDVHDFLELGSGEARLLSVKVFPMAFAPQLTYFRKLKMDVGESTELHHFNNSFILEQMLLKWNPVNRDAAFQYIHLFNLHKSLSHFESASALSQLSQAILEPVTQSQIQNNFTSFCEAWSDFQQFDSDLRNVPSSNYTWKNDYLVQIKSPQIQLTHEDTSCVLVAAPSIELSVVSIARSRTSETSSLEYEDPIETRVGAKLESASIFAFYKDSPVASFRGKAYGSNTSWPPWLEGDVPTDNMLLSKTSMGVRYDRVSDFVDTGVSDSDKELQRRNKVFFNVPHVAVSCDSRQYSTLYSLVWNLLIYSEPGTKAISGKLERLAIEATLDNGIEFLVKIRRLQKEIKILASLIELLSVQKEYTDAHSSEQLLLVANEQRRLSKELYLLMRSRTQKKRPNLDEMVEWVILFGSIVVHVIVDNEPLLELRFQNSRFERLESTDGSNDNSLVVGSVECDALRPDARYKDVFGPFQSQHVSHSPHKEEFKDFITVKWSMVHPVGGIKTVKNVDIYLGPSKLQLDQQLGKQIFEFVFNDEMKSHQKDTENIDNLSDSENSDNVDVMIQRSSKYMHIVQFKFHETQLCVSYKGEGKHKLISVNNFALKIPLLSVYEQDLSGYQISMLLRKEIMALLLSHSGKLIGNKLKIK